MSTSLIACTDEFLGRSLSLVDPSSTVCGVAGHFEFIERATEKRSRARRGWSGACARDVNGRVRCKRSEEHTSELQSQSNLVCRLLLEKKNINNVYDHST